jgi:hypothetical protein
MFFAIIALGMSVAQILLGIAIGLTLRKYRQGQVAGGDATRTSLEPHESPVAERGEPKHRHANPAAAAGTGGTGRREAVTRGAADPASASIWNSAGKADEESGGARPANESSGLPSDSDRRTSLRQFFEFRQNVAPYFGGMLPGKASFREVECHDISSTGFSFLSSQLPDFEAIVVALGVAPHLVYLQAQIVNRFQIEDGPAPLFRIGCRFVGQVN